MPPLPETLVVDRLSDVLASLTERQAELLGHLRELRSARGLRDVGGEPAVAVSMPDPAGATHPMARGTVTRPDVARARQAGRVSTRDYDYFSTLERRITELDEG